jgi:hypothetical protein
MSVSLGNKRPSYSAGKNWVARFRTGHLSTEHEELSGRPTQMTIPENVDVVHSMILDESVHINIPSPFPLVFTIRFLATDL